MAAISPAEETPRPSRVFHILLKGGPELAIPALTICDKEGTGRNLILKDEDTERIVGQLYDEEVLGWWMTEDGANGRTRYNVKLGDRIITIPADDMQPNPNQKRLLMFLRSGCVVGRLYARTWWRETDPPD